MLNYNQSIIYKIICKDETILDVYVGSTTNFNRRLCQHRENVTNYKCRKSNYKVYKFIREHGGWSNWEMIAISEINCDDKNELKQHERLYIDALNSTLNTQIPLRTRKEWEADNRDKINKNANNYYHENKQKCLESQKKWSSKNKDKISAIKKVYYQKNKDKILENKKIKYNALKSTNPSLSV